MAKGKHSKKASSKSTVVASNAGASTTSAAVTAALPVVSAPAVIAAAEKNAAPPALNAHVTISAKPTVSREAIAQRAFALFLARGARNGHALQDWLQAEAELGLGKQ